MRRRFCKFAERCWHKKETELLILALAIILTNTLKNIRYSRGTWVAQLVKHQTLDYSSDQDLRICEIEPCVGSLLGLPLTLSK